MKNSVRYLILTLFISILITSSPTAAQEELPHSMVYEYDDYSFWVGYSHLVADIEENGEVSVTYSVNKNSQFSDSSVGPFESSFDVTYTNAFDNWNDLFAPSINHSTMINWNTTRYQSNYTICDGGGVNKILTLNWTSETVVVEDMVDNDSCSGTRTNKSSLDIMIQLDHIHNFVINLVNARGTPTSSGSGVTLPFVGRKTVFVIPLGFLSLIVQRRTKKLANQ